MLFCYRVVLGDRRNASVASMMGNHMSDSAISRHSDKPVVNVFAHAVATLIIIRNGLVCRTFSGLGVVMNRTNKRAFHSWSWVDKV